jgi:rhodanese-related sulfurtransferase
MLKKVFGLCVMGAAILLLPACWPFSSTPSGKEAKFLLLDVNEPDVYADAHIKGAVNVPFEKVEEYVKPLNKGTEIVVHCSNYMCGTSTMVWKKLQELGFKNSYAYEGGTAEWYQLAQTDPTYHIEGPAAMEFLKTKVEKPEGPAEAKAVTAQELKKKLESQNSEQPECSACKAA